MSGRTAVRQWQEWVSGHRVAAALLAGLVATQIATVTGYWFPGIGLPQMDWNRVNGAVYTPDASADLKFLSGAVFHYADGVVFAVVFAVALHPLLRWRRTPAGNLWKGLLLGTALATVSVGFMIPRVYFPQADPGLFSHHLGWKMILAVYLWHWIYGAHIGLIYNPAADTAADGEPLMAADLVEPAGALD
ncbi:hypothetical protein [Streptomyces sp. CA-106131]|uniref:hypothetical protein n=1 Tax=Streptomyces sp. CA-106131 TaxID=3240045 RepID=UPI003D89D62A